MLERTTMQRITVALALLAAGLFLLATQLPNHAALLWVFGAVLLIASLITAVTVWNQKGTRDRLRE